MSTHTPGPWVYEQDSRPNRPHIATVAWVGEFCVGIPTPGFPGGNYRDAEYGTTEADARLIAAAPDLLAALEWAMPRLQEVGGDENPQYVAAMAAIAKAKGEE